MTRRLPPPPGLSAASLRVDAEEYLVLSHPLPRYSMPETLTPAEREVLGALLGGSTRSQIARERGTSANTVANIVASAFQKLGATSRLHAAALLMKASTE